MFHEVVPGPCASGATTVAFFAKQTPGDSLEYQVDVRVRAHTNSILPALPAAGNPQYVRPRNRDVRYSRDVTPRNLERRPTGSSSHTTSSPEKPDRGVMPAPEALPKCQAHVVLRWAGHVIAILRSVAAWQRSQRGVVGGPGIKTVEYNWLVSL